MMEVCNDSKTRQCVRRLNPFQAAAKLKRLLKSPKIFPNKKKGGKRRRGKKRKKEKVVACLPL